MKDKVKDLAVFCLSVSSRHIVSFSLAGALLFLLSWTVRCSACRCPVFVLTVVEEIRPMWAPEKAFLAGKKAFDCLRRHFRFTAHLDPRLALQCLCVDKVVKGSS